MRQLLPTYTDNPDLRQLYRYPEDRPWLRANMVASVDGAATYDGRSYPLSGDADQRVFRLLRGLADIIIVGAGTAPALAVISRTLNFDYDSHLFTSGTRPILITTDSADPNRLEQARALADVITTSGATVDLRSALTTLAERGPTRMLTEGGPHLITHLVTAGCLDELCLTVSPQLTGSPHLTTLAGAPLAQPTPLTINHAAEEEGFIFYRYLLRTGL
jgi:riboflavin biosynthesis pyrimidine reductase